MSMDADIQRMHPTVVGLKSGTQRPGYEGRPHIYQYLPLPPHPSAHSPHSPHACGSTAAAFIVAIEFWNELPDITTNSMPVFWPAFR